MSEEKTFHSPLEDVFGIEPNTTPIYKTVKRTEGNEDSESTEVSVDVQPSEVQVASEPEVLSNLPDDDLIEEDILAKVDEVYQKAIEVFDDQAEMIGIVDPKFAARTAEVANGYLNTALAAVKLKTDQLSNRKKNKVTNQTSVTNNNLIVADRNELLKAMMNGVSSDK
jgi:hypothetical protein